MAINEILNDDTPMVLSELSCTQDGSAIKIPVQPPSVDFCYCDFECEYNEEKFASPGNEDYKNDLSYFLAEAVDPSGTIVFEMFKNGALVATITDDTYGIYTPIGGFPSFPLTDHSLKSGFIADWEKIFALGTGTYSIVITVTNYSRTFTVPTPKYRLNKFSERAADETTVIKTTQNGQIQGGLDYTGLNWGSEFRVPGKLIYTAPDFETDSYLTSSRIETQIQDQIINNYSLSCEFIPSVISRALIENSMLANTYIIMDYNLFNDASLLYQDVSVYPTGIEDPEYYVGSQNGSFNFTFSAKQKYPLKRNFK